MAQNAPSLSKTMLWRDKESWFAGGLLLLVTLVAWAGVVHEANAMTAMSGIATTTDMSLISDMSAPTSTMDMDMAMGADMAGVLPPAPNALSYLGAWGVMMAAMMLPSAMPMILFYGALERNFSRTGQRGVPMLIFALVYLVLWAAFGIPIYLGSVALDHAAQITPSLASLLPYGIALVLIIAASYQFSSLKRSCLRACQSPLGFLMGHWRGGYRGTLKLALDHAAYCIGCCWALMLVLVTAGAMALHWVLLIAVVVFVEKLFPARDWPARVLGLALIALGLVLAAQPQLLPLLQGRAG